MEVRLWGDMEDRGMNHDRLASMGVGLLVSMMMVAVWVDVAWCIM